MNIFIFIHFMRSLVVQYLLYVNARVSKKTTNFQFLNYLKTRGRSSYWSSFFVKFNTVFSSARITCTTTEFFWFCFVFVLQNIKPNTEVKVSYINNFFCHCFVYVCVHVSWQTLSTLYLTPKMNILFFTSSQSL